MGKPLIMVSSVTYAMKGRELLAKAGIQAIVQRVAQTKETGCGYGLYVPKSADRAEQILRENNIKVISRLEQNTGR